MSGETKCDIARQPRKVVIGLNEGSIFQHLHISQRILGYRMTLLTPEEDWQTVQSEEIKI